MVGAREAFAQTKSIEDHLKDKKIYIYLLYARVPTRFCAFFHLDMNLIHLLPRYAFFVLA